MRKHSDRGSTINPPSLTLRRDGSRRSASVGGRSIACVVFLSVSRLGYIRGGCYVFTMPALILPLEDAAAHFPPRGGLIGLDLGTKTIGVAVSDPDRRLAAGVETIARKTFTVDADRILGLAANRRVVGFVLGLP